MTRKASATRKAYGARHVFQAPAPDASPDAARAGLTASEAARVRDLSDSAHTPNQIAALTRLPYRAIRVALGLPP